MKLHAIGRGHGCNNRAPGNKKPDICRLGQAGAGQKTQGAAKRVRREEEMTMKRPVGLPIGSSSAWADAFRPSLDAHHGPARV